MKKLISNNYNQLVDLQEPYVIGIFQQKAITNNLQGDQLKLDTGIFNKLNNFQKCYKEMYNFLNIEMTDSS